MDDEWVLQDSRDFVGNSMLFWQTGGGYTTDIDKAEVMTKEKAMAQHRSRQSDRPYPLSYLLERVKRHIDVQYVDWDLVKESYYK